MISDDERREVARMLRSTKAECESRDYPWMVEDLLQALGFERYEDAEDGIFERLADLIDRPTCYVVEHKTHCGSYGCEEAGTLWVLSCGDECVNDSDFPPSYCPECGAEVVEEGCCDVRKL